MNNIRNDELIRAFNDMQSKKNELSRVEFISKLSEARLLVPVVIDPEPVDGVIPKGASMTFFSMRSSSKKVYLATFTDYDQLCKWNTNPNKQVVAYNFDTIYRLITQRSDIYDGYVLNPAGENAAISRELMQNMYNAMHPSVTVKPERIATDGSSPLTPVDNPPERMVKALVEYCNSRDSILALYVMQTIRQGESQPTIVIVVDFAGDSPKSVFDGVALSLKYVLDEKITIGMMPAYDKVAKKCIKGVTPIYKKK